jgi:hypothetical protein
MVSSLRADWLISFIPNGSKWRGVRRAFHRYLNSTEIKGYHPLEQQEIHCLLRDLLEAPENFSQHLRQWVTSFQLTFLVP